MKKIFLFLLLVSAPTVVFALSGSGGSESSSGTTGGGTFSVTGSGSATDPRATPTNLNSTNSLDRLETQRAAESNTNLNSTNSLDRIETERAARTGINLNSTNSLDRLETERNSRALDKNDGVLRSSDTITDQGLSSQIRNDLLSSGDFSDQLRGVNISSSNGRVTLRGDVRSADERNHILSEIRNMNGVRSVDDQLRIQ